jgi:hypothetical protein
MDKTALIFKQIFLFLAAIAIWLQTGCRHSDVLSDNHFVAEGYRGWLVVFFDVPGGGGASTNSSGGYDFRYDDSGICTTALAPPKGWRRDLFYKVGSGDTRPTRVARGALQISGSKWKDGRDWKYACYWADSQPNTSSDSIVFSRIAIVKGRLK